MPMHELSLIHSIIEVCEQSAGGRKVLAVTLEVGELCQVLPEALEFCFAPCAAGTLLAGATLRIARVPGVGRCGCGAEFPLPVWYTPCPACGSYGATPLAGEELRVKELEVE